MICRNCRTNNPDSVSRCLRCGSPLYPYYVRPRSQPLKGLALAGMIVGIAGAANAALSFIVPAFFMWWTFILSSVALTFGIITRVKGNTSGMAMTALICGAVGLTVVLLIIILSASSLWWYSNVFGHSIYW